MIVFAQRKGETTSRVGSAMRFWYRCQLEDGSYAEDVPVDVLNFARSEALLDADARTTIAAWFADKLGGIFLATDIRIR